MENAFSYEGTRSLVVGCYSGMGSATAKIVQSLGGEVHGVDYRDPDYELASFSTCDLRDPSQIDNVIGGFAGSVDRLFYCAGLPNTQPPIDVMKVNFLGMRQTVDAVLPKMSAGGAVAIISSNAGLQFMEHLEPINELLATDGFAAGLEWSSSTPTS